MKILQGYYLTPTDKRIVNAFINNNYEVGYSAGTPQITFKLIDKQDNKYKFKRFQFGGWSTPSDRNGKIIEVLA
jgi:hypothetical protein